MRNLGLARLSTRDRVLLWEQDEESVQAWDAIRRPSGASVWRGRPRLTPPAARSRARAQDPRFERIPCSHKGTYADDCICQRVQAHRCYIVATCDRDLRRRLRKIPGVPIMFISSHRYNIERLPEATIGGAPRN